MKLHEAAAILRRLYSGIDPDTGEVLPADHLLHSRDVQQALMTALQAMDAGQQQDTLPINRSGRLNAGRPWTADDLADLRSLYESGMPLEEIARLTHRRVRGIRLQLNLMAGGGRGRDERVPIADAGSSKPPARKPRREDDDSPHRPWTEADAAQLRCMHSSGLPVGHIAARMNRTEESIRARLFYMGLGGSAPELFPPDAPAPEPAPPEKWFITDS